MSQPARVTLLRRAYLPLLVGLAGSVAVATCALGGALVSAQDNGDGRAIPVGSAGCPDGTTPIPDGALTYFYASGPPGQLMTITAVDPAYTVTAIVVTGGDPAASQMYNPGQRGLLPTPLNWVNLQAPLQSNGVLPNISGFVACGPPTPTTTTSTTTTTTSTTTTVPATTTTTTTIPATTTTQTGSTTTDPGTTTTTAAGTTTTTVGPTTTAARPTSTLPHTGGGPNTNTIGVAVLILLAGALATMVARRQVS